MAEAVTNADTKQYIVVELGAEHYGIDINFVDNIVRMQSITRVPKAQDYFKGVINLRGEVIPVMDLRVRFGLETAEPTNKTRILILKPEAGAPIGIIVDVVKEVLTLNTDDIEKPASKDPNDEKSAFISGIGKNGDALVTILNIMGVITEKEEEDK